VTESAPPPPHIEGEESPEDLPEAALALDAEQRRAEFWAQIRNSALQYLGVAWFLTQVFSVMGREFGWPPSLGNWVVILLGLGFVLAMLGSFASAWRHRMSHIRRRRTGLALAALATIGALAIWLPQRTSLGRVTGPSGLVSQGVGPFSTTPNVNGFFVVHPQEPLIPTNIHVTEGQSLSMWGEGRVNVGLASLVAAAERGDENAYDWVGPAGEVDASGFPVIRQDRGLPGRERCLLSQAAPYGALLAIITPSDRIVPATVRSLTMDTDVFVVGTHLETTVQTSGYLTLAVNDVYLDRAECDPASAEAGRDPGTFYRDNIGFFTVRLSVE